VGTRGVGVRLGVRVGTGVSVFSGVAVPVTNVAAWPPVVPVGEPGARVGEGKVAVALTAPEGVPVTFPVEFWDEGMEDGKAVEATEGVAGLETVTVTPRESEAVGVNWDTGTATGVPFATIMTIGVG